MAVCSEDASELQALGFGPDSDGALVESDAVGRRPLEELRGNEETFLVRRFSHGGLLRWLTGARFSDPRRPFHELLLSQGLTERGVRTPRVIAARARRTWFWWELSLVTARVEDVIDMGRWIADIRQGVRSRRSLAAALLAFGELVRSLHEVGFLHADLQPNNVLVEERSEDGVTPRLWILDLDRSKHGMALEASLRISNLSRLSRFVERRERERGACLTASDRMRFLKGYERERVSRHALWRSLSSEAGSSRGHGLGWMLERIFSGEDPRES
jgi:3-deoxy-D-manno-octulosonic acid kinase